MLVLAATQSDQLGSDIIGEAARDESGTSVSLSSDGTVVAIGAPLNNGNGNNAGHVRVYEWNASTSSWDQKGDDIDGEAAGDRSGSSVSLSSDGTIVAIGALRNGGNGDNAGHVRVYEWNASTSSWDQKGDDIDGEAAGDRSGSSVSVSSDGTIVAIGAPFNDGTGDDAGHVRVYEWNASTSSWDQQFVDIDGEAAGDSSGFSVSLSSDGTIVAIGAPFNDGTGDDAGNVRVYLQDGAVDPIDCSESLGLVQMFFNVNTRTATAEQLVLDSNAGSADASNVYQDFSPAWTVSLDVPGNDDLKELNGTAINPVDGKAYAAVRSDANREYLVRFDRDGDLEFLHEYTGATTVNNGTFDSAGRFYSAAGFNGQHVIQRWDNLDQSVGSTDPTNATQRTPDQTVSIDTNVPADLAAITVDGVEYIIGVPNNTSDVLMVFNTETLTSTGFDASSSLNRAGGTGLPTGAGYGAAWTFEGTSYLSQNDGGGLWALTPGDIDVNAETATLREVLQTTQTTQSNDGFACIDESITENTDLPGAAGVAQLVYHANGGTGDPDDLQTAPEENVMLSSQEPTRDGPARVGYTFVGWNTTPTGDGTLYSPSDSYVMPGDGETDHLYALWQQITATTTTTAAPTTTPTTTTVAPTTSAPPSVAPPSAGPADPVTGSPTFTG